MSSVDTSCSLIFSSHLLFIITLLFFVDASLSRLSIHEPSLSSIWGLEGRESVLWRPAVSLDDLARLLPVRMSRSAFSTSLTAVNSCCTMSGGLDVSYRSLRRSNSSIIDRESCFFCFPLILNSSILFFNVFSLAKRTTFVSSN